MKIEIEFNYLGQIITISCDIQDNWKKVFKKLSNKIKKDVDSIYFLYSGTIIDGNSTIEQKINSSDKERKKMTILVNDSDESIVESKIVKPKDISCPKCGDISKIDITDYKILFQCKNNHNKGNILLNEYKSTQKVDISKIKCEKCKINNKGNSYENMFFICCSCNINLCPLCKNEHDKSHNIINYDDKNYICINHNQRFNSYCETCRKNLCLFCEKEHQEKEKSHKLINYLEILPKMESVNKNFNDLKERINCFNYNIDELIRKLNIVKENMKYYCDIYEDIKTSIIKNNMNYEILYNYNNIKEIDIINDINNIINNKYNIGNILDIYDKMTNKFNDSIIVNYNLKKEVSMIRLFGESFVKNNKNNCKIKIEGKEYELLEFFEIKNLKSKSNILSIELIGISNISDMSSIFCGCSELNSLPNISNWNTCNIFDMNSIFSGCSSLNSIPNIINWNTSKVTNMNSMFDGCSSLNALPDISYWNTPNVTNLKDMFYKCSKLNSLPDISNWDVSKVINMRDMFFGCSSLNVLPDLSKWNISNVKDMCGMFYGCSSLTSLPNISNWKTSKVTNMNYMFYECSSLNSLPDISKWDISHDTKKRDMFNGCTKLKNIPSKFIK